MSLESESLPDSLQVFIHSLVRSFIHSLIHPLIILCLLLRDKLGSMVSGLVMSNTLVNAGASIVTSEHNDIFGASLKDAGGPSINVMTKLTCMVAILDTSTPSWLFFR